MAEARALEAMRRTLTSTRSVMTGRRRNNAEIAIRMQAAMEVEPQTYAQLVLISGLSQQAVERWVSKLRAMQPSPLHVAGYAEDERGRPMLLQFAWGSGPDAPRPGTSREQSTLRMRRLRARRKGGSAPIQKQQQKG